MNIRKLIVIIAISVFIIILLFSTGAFAGLVRLTMGSSNLLVSSGISKYEKDTDKYDDIEIMNKISEYNGNLYYIHPDSNYLYKYNEKIDDTIMCKEEMDYAIVYDNDIFYVYNNSLINSKITGGNTNIISNIDENLWMEIKFIDNRLFFTNDDDKLCSYNIIKKELKILATNCIKRYSILGDNIFYISSMGLCAMDLDGNNNKRIVLGDIGGFNIYDRYVYIVNESRNIFMVDLEENRCVKLIEDENIDPYYVNIINGKLYYIVRGSSSDSVIQADINAGNKKTIITYKDDEQCWMVGSDINYGVIWESKNGDASVSIYNNEDEKIKELTFQSTDIINLITFKSHIVVKGTIDNRETYIIYDKDYNERDRVN
jgi:hypothetical protein